MPLSSIILALILLECVREDLLARFGANRADFVVARAKF
jgi:hypothetical protein